MIKKLYLNSNISKSYLLKAKGCFSKSFLYTFFVLALILGSSEIVKAQVTASFTFDDTMGCSPLIVHFTNTSTGATSYTWNLGNGSPLSYSTNASGSYVTVGTYTVTLVATNGAASSTYRMLVHVYPPPTVNFSTPDTALCPGSPVSFTSTCLANMWGGLTYNWNFGDGYSSTSSAPTHAYGFSGYFNVNLSVTNAAGCTAAMNRMDYIHAFTRPVTSFFTPDSFGCRTPLICHFNPTSTGAGPMSYVWKFGDGSTSFATSPVHTYTSVSSYSVSLTTIDVHGCKDSITYPNYINFGTLAANFTYTSMKCLSSVDTFINTSTSYSSNTWSFGDGSTSAYVDGLHIYSAVGTYNVKLVARNGSCADSITHPITVYHPTGTFTVTPAQPCPAPMSTLFMNATVASGIRVDWLLQEYTELITNRTSISRNYRPCGMCIPAYFCVIDTIDMILIDAAGCRDTIEKKDTVYNFNASVTATLAAGCLPLTTTFNANTNSTIFDAVSGITYTFPYPYGIASYSWNFGDGTPTSSLASPTHTYTIGGLFHVVCTIVTGNGCTFTADTWVEDGTRPVATYSISPTRVCGGHPVVFTSTTIGATSYYWYFGDIVADSTILRIDTHFYFTPGIYTPHLVAYNHGCPSLPVYARDTIDSPTAAPHVSYACSPRNVATFSDFSIGATSRLWLFGDGTTSTLSTVTHTYSTTGSYTAKLTTFNSRSNCRDTNVQYLDLSQPIVRISMTDSTICKGIRDTALAGWTSTLNRISYKWFLDGVAMDSTHQDFYYTYWNRGYHSFMLINRDNHGCLDTGIRINALLVAKPIDSFRFTPSSGCSPLSVSFTDRSTDVTGATIVKYFWTFGNGDTTTIRGANPVETYTTPGTFSIKEIVTDNIGCKDTFTISSRLVVYKPAPNFTVTSTIVCAGAPIHFTNTTPGITGAYWWFGDGGTSSTISPDHVYSASGSFTIKMVAYDSHGCPSDTLTRLGFMYVNPKPVAGFTMDDSFAVCPPLNINFTNTCSGATNYFWSFGEGTTSISYAPSMVYVASGLYTIKLAATNIYNCSDTAYGHASVFGYAGAFRYTPLTECAPNPVHFSATTSHVTSIVWDFGDGVTSSSTFRDTISHVYRPGYYLPRLILTDTSGCTSYSSGIDSIKADTVVPGFFVAPNPICQFSGTTFTDTSRSPFATMTTYLWSFGSGATSTLSNPTYVYTVSGVQTPTLTVTDSWGCSGRAIRTLTVNPIPAPITGLTNICVGNTSTLADITTGGRWSSPGSAGFFTIGSTSGLVTGLAVGSAIVTYALPSGCINSTSVGILPIPTPITGANNICVGFTTTLVDTTTGGLWSSGSPAIATVGSTTGIVTGVSAGTALISYSLGPSYVCKSTFVVRINPIPNNITGSSSVCRGYTTLLSDTLAGGTWTSTNTGVGSIGSISGLVTGVSAGTTMITYYSPAGCYTILSMTVNPLSPITGITSVCIGTSSTLTDAIPGGRWISSTGAASIGSLTGLVTGVSAGTTLITYLLPTGCSATTTVNVSPLPGSIVGNPSICLGIPNTYTSTGAGTWTSSNTSVLTITSGGVGSGVTIGTATITYTVGSGCSTTRNVTVNPFSPILGNPQVCQGSITTLTNATTGGSWSSSLYTVAYLTATSGVVTGVSAGTASISYTTPAGCIADTIVRVSPMPLAISGPASICAGIPTTYTDTTGGIWTCSSTSVATVGTGSGIVVGVSGGTTIITFAYPSGCMATKTITVNPLSPIIGPTILCVGLTTILTDATPGGTWTSLSPGIASIDPVTGFVTVVAFGTSIISYTLPSGCRATAPFSVNSGPAPIGGTPNLCLGTTTALIESGGGTWLSSNTSVASIGLLSGVVLGVSLGTATITYSLGTGCSITTVVTVNPISAISGPTSTCQGQTLSLTDALAGGRWTSRDITIATVDSLTGLVTGVGYGTTIITYTLPTGCAVTRVVNFNATPAPITGATNVCLHFTSTLYESGTGGVWTSSAPTIASIGIISGIVNGLNIGTAIITYAYASGCQVTTTVTVTPISPITGLTTLCSGNTTTLADVVTGGTWTSSISTVASIDLTSGLLTGLTGGSSVISYILSSGCMVTTTVNINATPPPITGPASICLGLSATYTEIPGGTWSSSAPLVAPIGISTGLVNGRSMGTAIITYAMPTGCYTTKTINISPISPITGSLSVCESGTITLTDTTVGGSWSSSATGVALIDPATGTVIGVTSGTAIITYGLSSGCQSTRNLLVNPLPDPITGLNRVCAGFNITLSNIATGIWSTSGSTIATIGTTSGIVTGINAGTTSITFTLPTGCSTTMPVTILPLPAPITGTNQVCIGLNTLLADTSAGGYWSTSNSSVADIGTATGLVNGLTVGTATITYNLNTCLAYTNVTVNPLPASITGNSSVCVASTTPLACSPAGGTWSSSLISVANVSASSGVVSGVSAGTTIITYTLATGCITTTVITVLPIPPSISGATHVCTGSVAYVYDSSLGGTWSSSNTSVATITPFSVGANVSGLVPGTSILTYTLNTCANTMVFRVDSLPGPISGMYGCVGLPTRLTNAATGGRWTSSDTTIAVADPFSGIITGRAVGSVIITYTLATGCYAIKVESIYQVPRPITGLNHMCMGDTTTLHDATPGGVWSSSNRSIASVGALNGFVSGLTSGYAQISYTWGGCPAIINMVINPNPHPITGPSSLCALGASITLSNVDTPGAWTSIYVTVDTTGVVTSFLTGTGVVTYTLPSGCYITDTLSVYPTPAAITGPNLLCLGDSIYYHSATPAGVWSNTLTSAFASVDSMTGLVRGISTGLAKITYTVATGCYTTKTMNVNPLPRPITGPSTVCVGDTILMNDSLAGGVWLSGNTSIATIGTGTGLVTGIGSGIGTLSYNYTNRCGTSTVTKTINVRPLPNAGVLFGPAAVCVNASITLQDTGSVGVPVWTKTNPLVLLSPGSTTSSVMGLASGIDTIIYTVTNSCGTANTFLPITVKPLPDAGIINGLSSVCPGAQITLTDTTSGGVWSSSNTRATVSGGVVIGISPGLDTISYKVTNSCGDAYASFVVTILSMPNAGNITGPQAVCVNDSIQLIDTVSGGSWAISNQNAGININGKVNGKITGLDTVEYSVTNSCGTANTTYNITINPLPYAGTISGTDSVCVGDTLGAMIDTIPSGVWGSTDQGLANVLPNGTAIGTKAGIDSVTYSVSNSCGTAVATFGLIVRSEADCTPTIPKLDKMGCTGEGEILIYPNPTRSGTFTLNIYSIYQEDVTINVINMLGQKETKVVTVTNQPTNIKMTLAAGMYYVTAVTAHGRCTEKLVVEVDK